MRSSSISPAPAQALGVALPKALALLLEAHHYARNLRKEPWEFAVELPALLEAGCTRSALRWLAARGYVTHALEINLPHRKKRIFRQVRNLSLGRRTCLVLTESGLAFARQAEHPPTRNGQANGVMLPVPAELLVPRWDARTRELWLGEYLVKGFKVPALNQGHNTGSKRAP